MDLQLKDKVALVTGSSAGIRRAIADALAAEGAHVIVHGRSIERLDKARDEIAEAGGKVSKVNGDLGTDDNAAAVVAQVRELGLSPDILVNNAGVYDYATWEDVTTEEWEKTLNVDVLSAVRLIQAFLPDMKARGWGRILQIGSGTGQQPFPTIPQYGALKAAMTNMTVSLARHLKGTGVLTNVLTPGLIYSESVEKYFRHYQEQQGYDWGESWEDIEKGVTTDYLPNDTEKLGTVEEVAYVAAVMVSPRASFVSGANWRVDGGSTVGIN